MIAPLSPEELAALAEARPHPDSPLPWNDDECEASIIGADGYWTCDCETPEDAAHIVAAVNALPRLLAAIDARDREIAALPALRAENMDHASRAAVMCAERNEAREHADMLAARCATLDASVDAWAKRYEEMASTCAALRERLALTEARTAVPPPRDALPGLRALAASEAAAEVLP